MIAPERITLYCRKPIDGVRHAFPVDSAAKSHEGAETWARNKGWSVEEKYEPEVFEFENKGFDNIKIIDLYVRSEGGRAYQVILEKDGNKFRMDLREGTLMDVIELRGIQAGGRLNGTFCFAKEGSQTKLILEGTETHAHAVAEREKRGTFTKNISKKDLKPGYVYKTITEEERIFLGFMYSSTINKQSEEVSKPKKLMLFAYNDKNVIKYLKGEERGHVGLYEFPLLGSHSFKIEGEKVLDVTNEMIEKVQAWAKDNYTETLKSDKYYSMYLEHYTEEYSKANMQFDKKDVTTSQDDIEEIQAAIERAKRKQYSWRY